MSDVILVRVLLDMELVLGTLGVMREYTINRMPVNLRASYTSSHLGAV